MITKIIEKHLIYSIDSFVSMRYLRFVNFDNALKIMFVFFLIYNEYLNENVINISKHKSIVN